MKVLQVVPSYYPATVYGGPIFSIHRACEALARAGVDIDVATTNANGVTKLDVPTSEAVVLAERYRVRYYEDTIIGRFSLAFTFNLWRDIKTTEVVHLQDIFSAHAVTALLLCALFRKPLLVSARGELASWGLRNKRRWLKRLWLGVLVRPLVLISRRVFWHATSPHECTEIVNVFPRARIRVVPNAIDCAEFDGVGAPSRAEYLARFFPGVGVSSNSTRILVAMGRLHRKKGFDIAITAFSMIAKKHPEAVLLIAGPDDGVKETLERMVEGAGLTNRIRLVGNVSESEKIMFLKGAELFLFPSCSENFGMVCLESLAAGCPVVASRNTPWGQLEQERAGWWVENSPEAFATAIQDFLSGKSEAMRERARAIAVRYDLSSVATAFRRIYGELIGDGDE